MYISPSFYTFYKRYPSSHHLFYNGKAACKPIKWRKSRIGNNKNYDIYKILANYATHLKGEYIYPCYNVILLVTLVTNVWTGWEGLSSNPQNWQKYHDSTSLLLLLPCFPTHQIIHCLSQPVTFFDLILEFVPESSLQCFSLKRILKQIYYKISGPNEFFALLIIFANHQKQKPRISKQPPP